MFSALAKDMSLQRARGTTGGVWVAKADTPLGPFDILGAQQLTNSDRYVGRLINDRQTGQTIFLASATTLTTEPLSVRSPTPRQPSGTAAACASHRSLPN